MGDDKYIREIAKLERRHYPKMYRAINSQILSFIKDVEAVGVQRALVRMNDVVMNDELIPVVSAIYKDAGLMGAIRSYREVKGSLGMKRFGFGFNEEWIKEVLDYLRLRLLDRAVVKITETTKQQIMEAIESGMNNGSSIDEIVKDLRNSDLTKVRARMITRTEVGKGSNVGHQVGAKQFPFAVTKRWVAARDKRTRNSHLLLHGTKIGEDDVFNNGLKFPCDPDTNNASEIINCRCRCVYESMRDSNGRLIMRPGNNTQLTTRNEQLQLQKS